MRRRFSGFSPNSPRSISMAGRWSKGLLAAALGLGTLGTTLALVDVAPASAAGTPSITSISPTAGSLAGGVNNKITITGTNFEVAADDTVDFGPGNPGTVHSVTGTTSMVAYPPAATQLGSVQLTVTTSVSGGTSNAVTYTYAAAPTVTALYSANGPTTGGTTIIITGNNFVGPGGVTAVDFASAPRGRNQLHGQFQYEHLGRGARHALRRHGRPDLLRHGQDRQRHLGGGARECVVLVRLRDLHDVGTGGAEQRRPPGRAPTS